MIRRREFIAGLGSVAAWPVVARAQLAAMPVIGLLTDQSADGVKNFTVAFAQGLKETGYVEGQNVAIEYRWAENQPDRLPALAADLVRRRVAVIVIFAADGSASSRRTQPAHSRPRRQPKRSQSSSSSPKTRSGSILSQASPDRRQRDRGQSCQRGVGGKATGTPT